MIAEYALGAALTAPSKEYVYSGSGLLATIVGTATTYQYADHLSTRVETDASGNPTRSFGHFPFGETWYETGTPSKWKFTSYERDTESNLDYALNRFDSSRLGRFMSPDPYGGSMDIGDPQSLNRYVYALNNPINAMDPDGRNCVWDDGSFDSGDDPDTGSSSSCSDAGGTWIPNEIFARFGLGDWSPNQNSGLGDVVTGIQNGLSLQDAINKAVQNALLNCAQTPPGTAPKYCGPLQQGLDAAKKALQKQRCDAFYGGQGAQTLDATTYRFLDMNNPTTGAATIDPSNVFINSNGPYMNYTPTPGKPGPFGRYWTQSQFRGFILLHELGHQLSPITGFGPDAGSPLNQVQSGWVLSNCF